jgi:hypothetical protein
MRIRAAFTPWLLLALAALNLATPGSAAAAAAKLTGGTVTPTTGTTATAFQFSVHFIGSATDEAVTVSASVAGGTVPLSLFSGTVRNGTWTGSSTLPVGSWTVTYQSTSTGLTNPPFELPGQVVVTAPTPPPTPAPTPVPTARPTLVPPTATPRPATSVSPGVSQTPFGTTVTNPSTVASSSESVAPSPSSSPGAVPGGSRPFRVPLEGVVAIGLLGAVTVAAALGERRRRQAVEAFRAEEGSPEGVTPGEGLEDGWEDDVVEDETVATIDYEAPDEHGDPPTG